MSSEKTSQNISISRDLKKKMKDYIKEKLLEDPDDERYKSVSSFICSLIDNCLNIFKLGKTLDDFERLMDKRVEQFYNQMSGNVFIPLLEPAVILNSYMGMKYFYKNPLFYKIPEFYFKDVNRDSIKSVEISFERFRRRYLSSGITKEMNLLDIKPKTGKGYFAEFEFEGRPEYPYSHFLNAKILSAIFGVVGVKILALEYLKKSNYFRFQLEFTDLFFEDISLRKALKKKRLASLEANLKYFTNYTNVIRDKPIHSWVRLADNPNSIITFLDDQTLLTQLKEIEVDVQQHDTLENIGYFILKFFENIGWIKILDEKALIFHSNLTEPKFQEEIIQLNNYLMNKFEVEVDSRLYKIKGLKK